MLKLGNQGLVNNIVEALKGERSKFVGVSLSDYQKMKGFLELDINKEDIVIYFAGKEGTDFTILLDTEYNSGVLVGINTVSVEVSSVYGDLLIEDSNFDALTLEVKKIVHDAVHYKILKDDELIETDFYNEVYL